MTRWSQACVRLAGAIRGLTGWRRWGAAFSAGLLSAASTAPFGIWPVLALTFPVLVLLLDGIGTRGWRGLRMAASVGWWFGFGYFIASLWWVGSAFLVEADVFAWLLPVAVLAFPAGLAVFSALGLVIARLLWPACAARPFALALGLGSGEWLRGHVLTGFPWNAFGYAVADTLSLAQGAALVGLWGLTFLVIAVFATPVLLLDRPLRWSARAVLMGALVVLGTGWGWGYWRLATVRVEDVPGVELRLLQPAVSQVDKFAYGRRKEVLEDYLALSAAPSARRPRGLEDVTVLIWPESAFPFIYENEPWAARRIGETLPPHVVLVTGAARRGTPPPGQTSPFFNSVRVIGAGGQVLQSVDKVHLVPFGEYLPFQSTLERLGLEQLTRVRGGFSSGAALVPLHIPGAPVAAPLICYEAIFPGAVLPQGERPGFLLNVTNDAWFGLTPGPHQHFVQARLRAIEEGLPLVRAANTGISAVIDPLGREIATLELGRRGILDAGLPKSLPYPPPASRFANWVVVFILLIFIGLIFIDGSFQRILIKHAEVDRR